MQNLFKFLQNISVNEKQVYMQRKIANKKANVVIECIKYINELNRFYR